jgi:hypothetical protein
MRCRISTTSIFDDTITRLLVYWVGIYQFFHFILNSLIVLGVVSFSTFPSPPPEGWQGQVLSAMSGLALSDALSALLSLIFVFGFLSRKMWSLWLGIVALVTNLFAIIPFTTLTVGAGAWRDHTLTYVMVYVLTIPLLLLFINLSVSLIRTLSNATTAPR